MTRGMTGDSPLLKRASIYLTHPHAFIAPTSLSRHIPRLGQGGECAS